MQLVRWSLIFFLICSPPVRADESGYVAEAVNKFSRGLSNIALGWLEIPKNIAIETTQNGPLFIPAGFVKGMSHMVGRTVLGGFEVGTFPIPVGPTLQPGYAWEEFDSETTYR